ncbi:GNAT family N-acetyltransferase [Sneathiella sp.]|jgi:predicted N-acetyltransferase YhbS|uniref:GNAT family N-acetyltransferase n=1 Tax=Sneathiella sp. TaxID=1964365 RepID=UPI0039E51104
MYKICDEQPQDVAAIEILLDVCFGPERFKKTAYKIRENLNPEQALSFVAKDDESLLASIRYWPVTLGGTTEALLLGPIVVTPDQQGKGIGVELIRYSMQKAKAAGHKIVVLVGDRDYYARFGFVSAFDAGLSLPGPVDPDRFLVAELAENALQGVSGVVAGKGTSNGGVGSATFSPPCQA